MVQGCSTQSRRSSSGDFRTSLHTEDRGDGDGGGQNRSGGCTRRWALPVTRLVPLRLAKFASSHHSLLSCHIRCHARSPSTLRLSSCRDDRLLLCLYCRPGIRCDGLQSKVAEPRLPVLVSLCSVPYPCAPVLGARTRKGPTQSASVCLMIESLYLAEID